MRAIVLATALLVAAVPSAGFAEAAKFSTSTSTINQLVADPAAKAVVEKHMPQIAQAPLEQIGGQTLKALQGMAPQITDKLLADIDADLAKIK